ncbi:MAG: hypothetical protein AAF519_02665 [Bacteroidota bacterium]
MGQTVTPQDIIGTWSLNFTTTMASLNEESKARCNALSDESQTYLRASIEDLEISFSVNGEYSLNTTQGDQITGSWQWNEPGVSLEVVTSHVGNTYKIMGLSPSHLVIQVSDPSDHKIVFNTWYLEKQ